MLQYREIKANVLLASISGGTDIIACFMGENSVLPVYRGEIQRCDKSNQIKPSVSISISNSFISLSTKSQ